MKKISVGAEATVFLDGNAVLKQRLPKKYRIKELDEKLRLHRMRREAKVMEILQNRIPVPKLISVDEKTATIRMELIEGSKAKDSISRKLCTQMGKSIGIIHANDIIHGDLTTSNMIYGKDKLHFIDFGLSFFSKKDEDRAVDLHLFRQALNSSHSRIAAECFKTAINAYKKENKDWKSVLKRLEAVEERGRNRKK